MSVLIPPVRGKSWVFQVTALCIVLGMLLALSLKTQRQAAQEGIPSRLPALRAEFRNIKEENNNLQKDLAELQGTNDKLAKRLASGTSSAKGLEDKLENLGMLAGTVSVRGPGVIITLHDSPKLNPVESDEKFIRNYIIHDYDIRLIVNELYGAGAEAISINNQRLIMTSSIRCVGSVVLINYVQIAPPYFIRAIGNPDTLEKAIDVQGGVADVEGLFLLDMIEMKKVPDMIIHSYKGSRRFNSARTLKELESKD